MESKEVINKKILILERDKNNVLKDLIFSLNFLRKQLQKGIIDIEAFNITVKLFNGVSSIDDQLRILYDIRKETELY